MKKYVCFLFSIVLITLCLNSKGWPDSIIKSFDPDFHQHPIYWYERDVKKVAWMAMDEVAVFPVKGKGVVLNNSLLRQRFHPEASITEKNNYVIYLKTKEAVGKDYILSKLAGIRSLQHVKQASPIFYTSRKKHPQTRIIPTGEIIAQFPKECTENLIIAIEKEYGLERLKSFDFSPNTFLYQAGDPFNSLEVANGLYESGRVNYAYPNWLRHRTKRATPNDPLFPNQWHLDNTGQSGGTAGADVNITSVWDTYRGSENEVIAIVDDGLEIDHEDLWQNIITDESWDYVDGDPNPSPELVDDNHGTACAGVAAARGFNQIGVTGAAPYAGLVGHRLIGSGIVQDPDEASALTDNNSLIDIYSNSWGPTDGGEIREGPGTLTETAMANGVTSGRGGLGSIYVWAGGNGEDFDNSNYDGYANSRFTIAVAASTNDGDRAYYSEKGANIMVNAPSGGGTLGITTTDRSGSLGYDNGNYTSGFSGTSSATPLVAGIIALMIEANPDLTWRDVQRILATTAEKNDPGNTGWATNGAGYGINYYYGFGRIDAQAAVALSAASTCNFAVETNASGISNPDVDIPDNDPGGISDTITIADDVNIEFVEVYFTAADHTYWGDLEITLLSPEGTESVLSEQHPSGYSVDFDMWYVNWRFGSVRHFGESSQGDWTLTVRDLADEDTGTFQSWTIKIYGTVGVPPTAAAGNDQTVNEGEPVALDGSSSSDPDGTITSYHWTQLSGTQVTLSDSTSDQPTFTAPQVGKSGSLLTFRVTVTDDVCLQSNDTINVQVDNIPGSGGGGGGGCFINTAFYGSLF